MLRSDAINELVVALSKAQGQMDNAVMDGDNPYYGSRYATLASVRNSVRKPLADNGLAVSQVTEMRQDGLVLITTLFHASGQWLSSEFPLPLVAKPQEMGSALTYAKRYQLSAVLMISADDDDDGNAAQDQGHKVVTKPKEPAPNPIEAAPKRDAIAIPQKILLGDFQKGGVTDWIAWGSWFLECYKTSKTTGQAMSWLADNAETMDKIEKTVPKVYQRLKAAIDLRYSELEAEERGQN